MTPKAIGARTEAKILARLLTLGKAVSIPFGDNQRYDFIVDDGGKLFRAQVKTGRLRKGAIQFRTASVNGYSRIYRSYAGQVDLFLVWCPDNDGYYKVPIEEVGKALCNLRLDPLAPSAKCGKGNKWVVRWAKDFLL